ncbi:MAG: SUMF1/EgtB/PvdO family nonheme iron enzyme [Verrucomicrobia bacterium]|nr:SUMF1/EgtB/PvdO family nonheme iron enzyme [Verrucomicrobiota bacterium]
MHGNVIEWCLDWYGSYPSSAVTDPKGVSTGSYSYRVIRGGSWGDYAYCCRSAYRYGSYPGNHYDYYGFRVALAPVK